MNCGSCTYYKTDEGTDAKQGVCMRYPPQVVMVTVPTIVRGQMSETPMGVFPPVRAILGCGEYKIRLGSVS